MTNYMNELEQLSALLSQQEPHVADAIVLLAGDRYHRIPKVVELYHAGFAHFVVLTSNADNWGYGSLPSGKLLPKLLAEGIPEAQIVWEETAGHTRAEADATLRIAGEREWKRLLVVTTEYHLPRAFLTWLKAIQDAHAPLAITMIAVPGIPDFKQESGEDIYGQEIERTRLYQEKGDVASYKEGIAYLHNMNAHEIS